MAASPTPDRPITDLHTLPLILTITDMARIYRISVATIRTALSRNTFRPLPFEKYPYRWTREAIAHDLKTPRAKQRMRRHGFAAVKAKREADSQE